MAKWPQDDQDAIAEEEQHTPMPGKPPADDLPDVPDVPEEQPSGRFLATDDVRDLRRHTSGKQKLLYVGVLVLAAAMGIAGYFGVQTYNDRWAVVDATEDLSDEQAAPRLRQIAQDTMFEDVKAAIIKALGKMRDAPSVPLFIEGLDSSGLVRRESAIALAEIGPPAAAPARDALARVLPSTGEADRPQVAWALAVLGDARATDVILERFAIGQIQRLDGYDPRIIARLAGKAKLLELTRLPVARTGPGTDAPDRNAPLRQFAAQQLGEMPGPDIVEPLLALLGDGSPDVVREAATSLSRTADPRVGPRLISLIESRADLRDTLLATLEGNVGAPGIATVLASTQNEALRLQLVQRLKDLHDPRGADALWAELQRTPAPPPAAAPAAPAAPGAGPTPADLVANAARTRVERLRLEAIRGLVQLGDRRVIAVLSGMLSAPGDDRVLLDDVVPALGELNAIEAKDALKAFLQAREREQKLTGRATILRALGKLRSPELGPYLMTQLRTDDVQAAAEALGRSGYNGAFAEMTKIVRRPPNRDFSTPKVENETLFKDRQACLWGLAYLGNPAAAVELMRVIEDVVDDQRLRADAAEALGIVADDAVAGRIIEKVTNPQLDAVARAFYLQALWHHPTPAGAERLVQMLEAGSLPENVQTAVALAIGEAAVPALSERLVRLLDNAAVQRAAVLALLVGGTPEGADRAVQLIAGRANPTGAAAPAPAPASAPAAGQMNAELLDIARTLYLEHPLVLTQSAFDSGRVFRRIEAALSLTDWQRPSMEWAIDFVKERLGRGGEGPAALSARQVRERLAQELRSSDPERRRIVAEILGVMNERGILLAARAAEDQPGSGEARRVLRDLARRAGESGGSQGSGTH